jgi:hypothetical protein
MRSRRIDEQMAVLVESLRELRGDVREMRRAIETGVAAHARHVARVEKEQHDSSCDVLDRNPDGIRKPCNCVRALEGVKP